MSADNTICLGSFPSLINPGQHEYRVIHAQAIENCDDNSIMDKTLTDCYRVSYFGADYVFRTHDSAWNEAVRLHDEQEWVEYGISETTYDRPLNWLMFFSECLNQKDGWWKFNCFENLLTEAHRNNALINIIQDLNYGKQNASSVQTSADIELIEYALVVCDAIMSELKIPEYTPKKINV